MGHESVFQDVRGILEIPQEAEGMFTRRQASEEEKGAVLVVCISWKVVIWKYIGVRFPEEVRLQS